MPFQQILGQTQALNILNKSLENNNLSHAYLFYGPSGVGKKSTAVELAKSLNCSQSGPVDNCGNCVSCRKIDQGLHPDIFIVSPTKTSPTVRESAIRIEDIRELQKKLNFMPYEGKIKVAIIDEADKMNLQAANTFLKTLEEPPRFTLIILVASNLHQLLPTLVSRCQGVKFAPLTVDAVRTILSRREGMDPAEADLRARRSGGKIDVALDDQVADMGPVRAELLDLLKDLSLERMDLAFQWTKTWSKQGDKLPAMLEELAMLLRDLAILRAQCGKDLIINRDMASGLETLAMKRRRAGWLRMFQGVVETRQFLKENLNVQLLLERMLIQFCEAI